MSWFEKNRSVAVKSHPYLKDVLGSCPAEDLILKETRSGNPTGIFRKRYIHSRFDPLKEASRLIEFEYPEEAGVCLFYGFGLGYQVEIFIKRFPRVPAVIFEPDPSLFVKALHSRELRGVLSERCLRFFIGRDPESLPQELDSLPFSKPHIIRLRSLCEENGEYYQKLDWIIQSYQARREINLNTLNRFGKLWVRNLARNLTQLLRAPGVHRLKGLFSGIPSIVIASGPSLDTVFPYLTELRERFLLISVDTSLAACLQRDVEPDFLVVVDPQYWNTRHLDGAFPVRTFLVSESSTHPRIFQNLHLPTFFAGSLFPLGEYIEALLGEKGKLGAGGSVATSAWDLARMMGARPIYMAGLDLGYPDRQTHFRGAFFETLFYSQSTRLRPVEQMSFSYLVQANPFPATSCSDGRVLTDQRMMIYKWWFENQMKIFPDNETRSLSPGGVKIEGVPLASLESLLSYPPLRERIEEKKRDAQAFFNGSERSDLKEKVAAILRDLLGDLSSLLSLASEAIKETNLLQSHLGEGHWDEGSLARLNGIDTKILQVGSRQIVGFLIQTLIQKILDGEKDRRMNRPQELLSTSGELYREIQESATYHIEVLERALAEMESAPPDAPERRQEIQENPRL
ncbi:MAG TPA: 6-hydroxymethylpterin diphosphokinase MptE-like protein [Spirochaetia bacterium]|nr:6-hydroxymethylpterin diphosphokinase MptE-like protein [Spirochaetia bacterium]